MKTDIKKFFKDSKNTVLLVPHEKNRNILFDWPHIRSPLRIAINYVTIKVSMIFPIRLKIFLLKHVVGIRIGKNVAIAPEVEFDPFHPELIEIEDNAVIGMDTYILTHEFIPDSFRFSRVKICRDSLISAFCTIRSGVTIGEGAQVAMCSFVNKDIPPHELWGGVPARFIKSLKEPKQKKTKKVAKKKGVKKSPSR